MVIATEDSLSPKLPFTHGKHVPDAWLNPDLPERLRDCRGCHNYSPEGSYDPQAVCTECHFNNAENNYTFELSAASEPFLTGLEVLRSDGALFQHSNHLILECRECHEVSDDLIAAPILMPKVGGIGLCNECHTGSKPRQNRLRFMQAWRDGTPVSEDRKEAARGKLVRGLVEVLNGSPEMGPNRGVERYVEGFFHGDHILPEHLEGGTSLAELTGPIKSAEHAREANCGACHGPMFDAVAGFETAPGAQLHAAFDQEPENCGACHISDANFTPLEFQLEAGTVVSHAAGTFSHSAHLGFSRSAPGADAGKSSPAGYDAIESEGCLACHVHDAATPEGYVLRGALGERESFHGCQDCHAESEWAPAEHGDWWTHRDHGNWRACNACHTFGAENLAQDRPTSAVDRRRPGRFRVETQAHPHITTPEGGNVAESCARCHRQPVEVLPSRIAEAEFTHKSHLPAQPTGAECAECHGNAVSGAQFSADIGTRVLSAAGQLELASEARRGLSYDPAACATCHLGSPPVPISDVGAALETREVTEFSHAAHVGSVLTSGREVACTDCHAFTGQGAEAGAEFVTIEAAANCTQCHDHSDSGKPEGAPSTGDGVTAQEIAACSLCHIDGIQAVGRAFSIPAARVVDLVGSRGQFHPSGVDCSTCHIPREGLVAATVPSSNSRVFARRTFFKPEAGTSLKPAIHRGPNGGTRKITSGPVDCFACHWTNTLVDSSDSGTAIPDPERPRNRKVKGDKLKGFPGGRSEDPR